MEMICRQPDCSGCGACQNICPKDAISMLHEIEGTYPNVDKEKCIKCGLCVKVCPINDTSPNHTDKIYPRVYACRLKDLKTLKNSASGGAFIAFSRRILLKGGVVYGAVSEENFQVRICAAKKENELVAMQGSKYVESNTNYTFREVRERLAEGKVCLYAALPCQIAGLLSYLKTVGVSLNNLYTIDIVCHGTPSEILYLSWLHNYEENKGTKLAGVKHRYKQHRWNSMVPKECAYISADGKYDIHKFYRDGYLNGFLQGKIYKNNCYECKYAHMPRISDITLGDFTGLGAIKKCKAANYRRGVSQLLINTVKGQELFDGIKDQIIYEERELLEALFFNKRLWKSSKKPVDVNNFFQEFREGVGWDKLRKHYLDRNIRIRINMCVKALIPKIFSAQLTVKAMYILKRKKMSPDEILRDLDQIFGKRETDGFVLNETRR